MACCHKGTLTERPPYVRERQHGMLSQRYTHTAPTLRQGETTQHAVTKVHSYSAHPTSGRDNTACCHKGTLIQRPPYVRERQHGMLSQRYTHTAPTLRQGETTRHAVTKVHSYSAHPTSGRDNTACCHKGTLIQRPPYGPRRSTMKTTPTGLQ